MATFPLGSWAWSPATEAIMGAVPKEKAGVGLAVNDATRLFGGTLGGAVIGSVAASLYTSRLAATLPAGLPARATAARGSVGGAVIAAHQASQAGLAHLGSRLKDAAILAFLHSFAGGCLVAGGVAAAGALVAIFLLPARPRETRVTGTDSQLASAPGDDVQARPVARGRRAPAPSMRPSLRRCWQRLRPASSPRPWPPPPRSPPGAPGRCTPRNWPPNARYDADLGREGRPQTSSAASLHIEGTGAIPVRACARLPE